MTDGVLLRELQTDPQLSSYSTVIIDEAHERTIQTDALFGILKSLTATRKDLRLIISSATLHAEKFSHYFHDAAIFKIPGRLYKVKIKFSKKTNNEYVDEVVNKVMKIHTRKPLGDILVFLPGQEEIEACCSMIRKRNRNVDKHHRPDLLILPAYSALVKHELSRIFSRTPPNCRKVVVATNIAETSLTIDGIIYVIDPGLVKQKVYSHQLAIDQLVTTDVSRAQADQRAGRAGRVARGVCYRLYTERHFQSMPPYTVPEIQRANLANTVLQLTAIGVARVDQFDFIDAPGRARLEEAVRELVELQALRADGALTALGRCMAAFPLAPLLAKLLIMSAGKGCSEEMLTVVAMLCVQNVFERTPPPDAAQRKQALLRPQGDHVTLLHVFLCWREADCAARWSEAHGVRQSSMRQAQSIRDQLEGVLTRCGLAVTSCGTKIALVQNTIALYYFRRNAARKEPGIGYLTLADDQLVHIHPASALFQRQPDWVVYHDIVITKEKYIREVTKINAHFLRELIPAPFQ